MTQNTPKVGISMMSGQIITTSPQKVAKEGTSPYFREIQVGEILEFGQNDVLFQETLLTEGWIIPYYLKQPSLSWQWEIILRCEQSQIYGEIRMVRFTPIFCSQGS